MQDIFITHPDFSYSHTNTYELSIAFRPDAISFIISGKDYEQIFAAYYKEIESYTNHEEYIQACEAFFAHEACKHNYKKTSCVFFTERITIVPASLFSLDDLPTIFSFNHVLSEKESVLSYKITNADSFLLYPVHKQLLALCTKNLGIDFQTYPQSAALFEASILENKHEAKPRVWISLESSFFDIIVLQGPNVLLYNTFTFSNVNDYVYYVMNVFEQLQLNPMITPVVVSGKINPQSSYYEATSMFIKQVQIVEPYPSQKKHIETLPFTKLSFPLFFQLFSLRLCE